MISPSPALPERGSPSPALPKREGALDLIAGLTRNLIRLFLKKTQSNRATEFPSNYNLCVSVSLCFIFEEIPGQAQDEEECPL